MTAHERLKKDFEEFRDSVLNELQPGVRIVGEIPSRLDVIENRLAGLEKPWWKKLWKK
jgi:hypothetical protein